MVWWVGSLVVMSVCVPTRDSMGTLVVVSVSEPMDASGVVSGSVLVCVSTEVVTAWVVGKFVGESVVTSRGVSASVEAGNSNRTSVGVVSSVDVSKEPSPSLLVSVERSLSVDVSVGGVSAVISVVSSADVSKDPSQSLLLSVE